MKKTTLAFTLVELVIVIVILGVLSSIGFVSYSNYIAGSRDANRVSQLRDIYKGLQLYGTNKKLPYPDTYVTITASGTTVGYQGYAGADTLKTIGYSNGGQDPKDKTYFTYSLSKDRKELQVLGFLEEKDKLETQVAQLPVSQVSAANYIGRYPKSTGNKLGIILQDITYIPIQDIITGTLDLSTTTSNYNITFDDNISAFGTGATLLSTIAIQNPKYSIMDGSLVLYANFNNDTFFDESYSKITGTFTSSSTTGTSLGRKSAYFPGGLTDYIDLGSPTVLTSGLTDFSVSTWTKLSVSMGASTNWHILGNESYLNNGFEVRIESPSERITFRTNTSGAASTVASAGATYPNDQKWHHVVIVKKGSLGKIYIDGNEVSYGTVQPLSNYAVPTYNFSIASARAISTAQTFQGYLDDIRIYKRAIGMTEIKMLYNESPE